MKRQGGPNSDQCTAVRVAIETMMLDTAPEVIYAAARALAATMKGEPVDYSTLTPAVVLAAKTIDDALTSDMNKSIEGAKFVDRLMRAAGKAETLIASTDRKDKRTTGATVAGMRSRIKADPPLTLASIADFIEQIEDKRIRKSPRRHSAAGRPATKDGARTLIASDMQLVRDFGAEHGRWPYGNDEWTRLARQAGGRDSQAEDPESTVARLQRNTRTMRRPVTDFNL